jgi:hypothetical protein
LWVSKTGTAIKLSRLFGKKGIAFSLVKAIVLIPKELAQLNALFTFFDLPLVVIPNKIDLEFP